MLPQNDRLFYFFLSSVLVQWTQDSEFYCLLLCNDDRKPASCSASVNLDNACGDIGLTDEVLRGKMVVHLIDRRSPAMDQRPRIDPP
jgi:hypothetical protein